MGKHTFGGDWTTDKLERVRKYLRAYTTIFTRNPKARFYTTIYVDAFAGSGYRADTSARQESISLFQTPEDKDAESLKKGSARVALEVEPSFGRYVFVERRRTRIADLKALGDEFPAKRNSVEVVEADANVFLRTWCNKTDWRKYRAVVFLDPYGMQVDWPTLQAIASTRAIDLWLLFPLGVAVSRLLTKGGPPPKEWAEALTRTFGTKEWGNVFYPRQEKSTLFGSEVIQQREGSFEEIGAFFLNRLRSIFAKVADNPLPLLNSTNTPIYLLCFAAGNPTGAKTAVKIAQDILKA